MLEPRGIGLIYGKDYYGRGVPPLPLCFVFIIMDVPVMIAIFEKDLVYRRRIHSKSNKGSDYPSVGDFESGCY
jgi:hypothetical protein